MAKLVFVFLLFAIFCLSVSVNAEGEEATTTHPVMDGILNFFNELKTQGENLAKEHLTEERKADISKAFDDVKGQLSKGLNDLKEAIQKATNSEGEAAAAAPSP